MIARQTFSAHGNVNHRIVSTKILPSVDTRIADYGVFFGFYPAPEAARLDPIDALRYE